MRKAKQLALIMAAVLAGGSMLGCGNTAGSTAGKNEGTVAESSGNAETTKASNNDGGKIKLTFFHYLEQYQDQFGKLVELYKEKNPNVELEIEIIGSDYDKILQTRVASGEVPDIFLSGPFSKNELYSSVSYDLGNEDFINEVEIGKEYRAANGQLTAVPFSSQAWGILYNKEVFEKAGIEEQPKTLEELEGVCKKLKDAGYIPFAQGYKSNYIKTQFFGFTFSVDDNCEENIQQLKDKTKELKDFDFIQKIFNTAELVNNNTQPNPFDDDFAAAAARLGLGEAAMMVSGDWIVGNAQKANPDCKLGLMVLPLSDDPADAKIYVSASTGLHINKDSKNLDVALDFLNWLVTSPETKDWMSNDMRSLSAIKGVSPSDSPVLEDAMVYIENGQTGIWASNLFPSGIDVELIPAIDKFLLGEITKEDAIDEMNEAWKVFE